MRAIPIGLLAVPLLALSACGGESADGDSETPPSASPEPETVATTVGVMALDALAVVDESLGNPVEDRCNRWGGEYLELKTGASVVVRNDEDRIVGSGSLGEAVWLPGLPGCQWSADVEVLAGGGYYYAELLDWESRPIPESELSDGLRIGIP